MSYCSLWFLLLTSEDCHTHVDVMLADGAPSRCAQQESRKGWLADRVTETVTHCPHFSAVFCLRLLTTWGQRLNLSIGCFSVEFLKPFPFYFRKRLRHVFEVKTPLSVATKHQYQIVWQAYSERIPPKCCVCVCLCHSWPGHGNI